MVAVVPLAVASSAYQKQDSDSPKGGLTVKQRSKRIYDGKKKTKNAFAEGEDFAPARRKQSLAATLDFHDECELVRARIKNVSSHTVTVHTHTLSL